MERPSEHREEYEDPRPILLHFPWPREMEHGLDRVTFAGYDFDNGFVAIKKDGHLELVSPFQLTIDGRPLLELAHENYATRSQLLTTIQ